MWKRSSVPVTLMAALLLATALFWTTAVSAETVLRRGNSGEPDTLDPHKSTLAVEATIVRDFLQGLVRGGPRGGPVPGSAASWTISEDGLIYEFTLRPGLVWSDGVPVTADDFVASFQRLFDPKTAAINASLFFVIENARAVTKGEMAVDAVGVKALAADRLRITLEHPDPMLITHLASRVTAPVPRHVIERHGKDWVRPGNMVANGPFILQKWSAHETIELVRNPLYYDADKVAFDRVIYYPNDNVATGVKQYRAGEIDFLDNYPINDHAHLVEILGDEVKRSPSLTISYLIFNFEQPLYQDLRVRKALSLAIDRETLTEKVLRGTASPAYRYTPWTVVDYEAEDLSFKSSPMEERLTEARRLLAEAGYSRANPLEVIYNSISGPNGKATAIAVRAMWQKIGVKATIDTKEMRVHYANMDHQKFDVGFSAWIGFDDPHQYLSALISTEGEISYNSGHYSNATYDRLIAEGVLIADKEARFAKFGEAEKIMLEEVALIPMYFGTSGNLVKPYLKGYTENPYNIHASEYFRFEKDG